MKSLLKPKLLQPGDKVATISLSWGGAGDLVHRYYQGKKQLQQTFGLQVVETANALKSAEFLAKNPQVRAQDLMEAFADSSIKAIISNIGGEDSIRTLPYTDLAIIKANPKIFLGFSDTTVTHWACYKAGLTSFYGTSLLVGFAENGGMHPYQIADIQRTLFSTLPIGPVWPNGSGWTSEHQDWNDLALQGVKRKLNPNRGWNYLQGRGQVQGRLLGGCVEVLEFLKGTDFWLSPAEWQGAILFLETSEESMEPVYFRRILRNYAAQGIFQKISGLLVGRPYDNKYTAEYNQLLLEVIREEQGQDQLPIITEMDFGHTCPTFTLPYGVMAQIDGDRKIFSLLESGVSP
ncbi:LD-carboxypeptidase [Adhaeribacter arboris]|uniref:LD-carboxypeptidase n=1 Tax=Adhaeribacter arboris TaxID=2072846 RepID=A0A2T2YK72_9BACT|nr:S66 peptidase family protein [Adhaeribacter arboris]PSR55902.1 LD-carboxypeptidase [Adhaeribacter arboris]